MPHADLDVLRCCRHTPFPPAPSIKDVLASGRWVLFLQFLCMPRALRPLVRSARGQHVNGALSGAGRSVRTLFPNTIFVLYDSCFGIY
ncbi:hypothetical protein BRADI_1g32525v3 [Brachypodium distachyon]|uniref:Uncharacterized protein n=1 Tax=Brachypodium distachyon TaxID=15368 RepID=A0A2K2DMD5_BRADI|nr:hypothetical protein BRADI_1g32525v3 [Brachypodium distachyon]